MVRTLTSKINIAECFMSVNWLETSQVYRFLSLGIKYRIKAKKHKTARSALDRIWRVIPDQGTHEIPRRLITALIGF